MEIVKAAEKLNLEQSLEPFFKEFEQKALEWSDKAKAITVTDASQTGLMKQAREGRLAMRQVRLGVDAKHKELKEESLRTGQTLDAIKRRLNGLIEPIESHLQQQEDFIELQEEKRKKEVYESRMAILKEIGYEDAQSLPLAELSEDVFNHMINGFKVAKEETEANKLKAKQEEEAKQKQTQERLEKEAMINDRIKRISAIGLQWNEQYKVFNYGLFSMAMCQVEDNENFESEFLELSKSVQIEKQKAVDLQNKKNEENRKAQEILDAAEKNRKDQEAAARKLKRAPDKTKLLSLASQIELIEMPVLKDETAQEVLKQTRELLKKVAKYIRSNAENL